MDDYKYTEMLVPTELVLDVMKLVTDHGYKYDFNLVDIKENPTPPTSGIHEGRPTVATAESEGE